MASIITHVAIPLTLTLLAGRERVSGQLMIWAMLGSVLPDIDVLAFTLGIPYDSQFGHRGFTHSIPFALIIALIGLLFHGYFRGRKIIVFSVLFLSVLSHGLLDALTNGGYGVAFAIRIN